MAAAYIKIYVSGTCIRTFGGNKKNVRELKRWYENATFESIHRRHSWITKRTRKGIYVEYHNKS